MNIYQKIAKNFSFRSTSQFLCKLMNFGFILYLTNNLGDAIAGSYFWIITTTNIIALIVDCGFATILTRECGKDRENAPSILFNMIILKISAATIMILALHFTLKIISNYTVSPYVENYSAAIYIFGLFWIFNSFIELFCGVFIAFEKLEYDAVINLLHRGVSLILGILMIFAGFDILGISIAYFIASGIAVFYGFLLIHKRIFELKFKFNLKQSIYLLKESLPLAFALLFSSIYFKIDQNMLGYFRASDEVGLYGSVFRIVEIMIIFPQAFTMILLPIFSRLYLDSKEKLGKIYKQIIKLMFIVSLPMCFSIMFFSKTISGMFGDDFVKGAPILNILIWSICLIFMNFILLMLLTAIGKQKVNAISNAVCVFVNVILNIIFIPIWGGIGAAITTILTECVVFGICYKFISNEFGKMDFKISILKPIIALIVGITIVLILNIYNSIIGLVTILLVYSLLLLIFKVIDKRDMNVLIQLMNLKRG